MINIVNNILSSCGYEQVDIDIHIDNHEFYLFRPSEENFREEYFVTFQLKNQSDLAARLLLDEEAQELFEAISGSGKVDIHFEKNCTMLICNEEGGIGKQTILALEEDQYNFKKNVITYTPDDLKYLKDFLAQNNIDEITNSVINMIINSGRGQDFLEFKYNTANKTGHYSIMLKIVLKMPFITYSPHEQLLINLNGEIKNALNPYQSSLYSRLMESEIEWTDENLHQQISTIWGDLA